MPLLPPRALAPPRRGRPLPSRRRLTGTAGRRVVYDMAVQRPPNNFCDQLYERYKAVYVDYLRDVVMPQLRERGGAFMLAEIGKRWTNHRDVMVKWMKKFFLYLDQYYTKKCAPFRSICSPSMFSPS